jgi:hypothetical protein
MHMLDRIPESRLLDCERDLVVSLDMQMRKLEYDLMILKQVNDRIRAIPGKESHSVPSVVNRKVSLNDRVKLMDKSRAMLPTPKRVRKENGDNVRK